MKITCYACKGHIEFDEKEKVETCSCPHCGTMLVISACDVVPTPKNPIHPPPEFQYSVIDTNKPTRGNIACSFFLQEFVRWITINTIIFILCALPILAVPSFGLTLYGVACFIINCIYVLRLQLIGYYLRGKATLRMDKKLWD